MIYLVCPACGYTIDIFTNEEIKNPVRQKRLKYLTTRDQVCPNCLTTISKCEKIVADIEEIPIFKVSVPEADRESIRTFCRENGYAVVRDYTVSHYRGETK